MDISADVEAWGQCLITRQNTGNDIDFSQNARATLGFCSLLVLFFSFALNICLFTLNYETNVHLSPPKKKNQNSEK